MLYCVSGSGDDAGASNQSRAVAFVPKPRMNSVLTQKHGVIYLYGGLYEAGDTQVSHVT